MKYNLSKIKTLLFKLYFQSKIITKLKLLIPSFAGSNPASLAFKRV